MITSPEPEAKPPPAVSVVLPAFNREGTIRMAIESVLRQTWDDFELIVVDDHSADGTVEAIRAIEDPRLILLRTPQNMGPSGARNTGLRAARGKWVAFQDSDDEWLPEKLRRQMERLQEPDEPWVACYCGMAVVGSIHGRSGRNRLRYIPNPEITAVEGALLPTVLKTSLISTQMLIARRSVLERIGGFDENLPALEDWDLVLRLACEGSFAFVDEPLVLQRFSQNSITHDIARRILGRSAIIEKHGALMGERPKQLANQYRILAGEHRQLGRFAEARAAMRNARRADPRAPELWLRYLHLELSALLNRRKG